jgi:hypothetical protein
MTRSGNWRESRWRVFTSLETLTDPSKRAEYDRSLRCKANEATAAAQWMFAHGTVPDKLHLQFDDRPRWSRFVWPAAGMIGLALLSVFLIRDAAFEWPMAVGDVLAGEEPKRVSRVARAD